MELLRWLHILAGATALASFWIPLVATKGGTLHRRAGWVYALAMALAALAAWALCGARLLDRDPENDLGALFLAFVGLLTSNNAWMGIRALRRKGQRADAPDALAQGMAWLLGLAGLGLLALGARHGAVLLLAFGGLGVALAAQQLRYWRRPAEPMGWWFAHMNNMLAATIGTITAFLVVNVPRLGLQRYALLLWLAPGLLGGIASSLWARHYQRKFAARKTS